MNKDALILFLRYPERGAVKTRIAETLGAEMTYELYRRFLADLAQIAREVNAEKIMVYSGPENAVFPDFPGLRLIRQWGTDIGERMYFAFQDVFALGFERCVLIGCDSPDLQDRLVNEAFDKLTSVDVVFGPCADGGYYLVGCKSAGLCRSMFSDISWSTAEVLEDTLKQVAKAGLSSAQLEAWPDIDEAEDLKQFYERNRKRTAMLQTMKFLDATGIFNAQ